MAIGGGTLRAWASWQKMAWASLESRGWCLRRSSRQKSKAGCTCTGEVGGKGWLRPDPGGRRSGEWSRKREGARGRGRRVGGRAGAHQVDPRRVGVVRLIGDGLQEGLQVGRAGERDLAPLLLRGDEVTRVLRVERVDAHRAVRGVRGEVDVRASPAREAPRPALAQRLGLACGLTELSSEVVRR